MKTVYKKRNFDRCCFIFKLAFTWDCGFKAHYHVPPLQRGTWWCPRFSWPTPCRRRSCSGCKPCCTFAPPTRIFRNL